jgi:hypothetical protein
MIVSDLGIQFSQLEFKLKIIINNASALINQGYVQDLENHKSMQFVRKWKNSMQNKFTRQLIGFPHGYKFCSDCQCNGRAKYKTPSFNTCNMHDGKNT